MSFGGFIVLLVIAGVAGALGQAVGGFSRGGCVVSILVGFAGAWLGAWIASRFGLPPVFVITIQGEAFPLVWAIIGGAVLSALLGLVSGRPSR